jgi:hypothetical protein
VRDDRTLPLVLLPGSLPTDSSTLKALCENSSAHSEIAEWIQACAVETFDGSWSDAERMSSPLPARRGGLGWGKDSDGATTSALQSDDLPHPNLPPRGGEEPAQGTITRGSVAIASLLHAALGLSDLTPLDPSQLLLTDAESVALCEAADALMREEGVQIEFIEASQWRVTLNREIDVLTERPDWIIGEPLRPNLPRGRDARLVERWMNELQMLFFSHPVNEARQSRGLPVVNMVWLWGFDNSSAPGEAGALGDANSSAMQTPSPQPSPLGRGGFDARMLVALRNGDLPGWQRAWDELSERIVKSDAIIIGDSRPRLLLRKPTGSPTITQKLHSLFVRKSTLASVLQSLQQKL